MLLNFMFFYRIYLNEVYDSYFLIFKICIMNLYGFASSFRNKVQEIQKTLLFSGFMQDPHMR